LVTGQELFADILLKIW